MKNNIVIVIPAYNPNKELLILIKELQKNEYSNIVVIDDGSDSKEIFESINQSIKIITHEKNKGKGAALKTAINYCLENFDNIDGIITIDADGQHLIKDINNVYNAFIKNRNKVIFGSRTFKSKNIPFRSRIGNVLFSKILFLRTKVKIRDTQTGLRAIPMRYLFNIKEISGDRFEYETNMLLYFIKNKIKIYEVDIEEVYINKNKSSNFKAIKDSIKIIQQLYK